MRMNISASVVFSDAKVPYFGIACPEPQHILNIHQTELLTLSTNLSCLKNLSKGQFLLPLEKPKALDHP